jgi:single-strand DNA-binding protein
MNQVQLMGRLTAEPVLRYLPNKIAVAQFTLAVNRKTKDKEEQTDFFPVVAWRAKAEFVGKYLHKGLRIVLTGELRTRNYTDKDGIKRWVTEILAENIYFADGKAAGQHGDAPEGFTGVPDGDELPWPQ